MMFPVKTGEKRFSVGSGVTVENKSLGRLNPRPSTKRGLKRHEDRSDSDRGRVEKLWSKQ